MPKLGTPEWDTLIQRLYDNDTTLTFLDLRNNQIGDAEAKVLSLALKNNRTLIALDLSFNQIGEAGVKDLRLAFKDNYTLTELNLKGNQLSDNALGHLIYLKSHTAFDPSSDHAMERQNFISRSEILGEIEKEIETYLQRNRQLRDQLHQAVQQGNLTMTQQLLAQGVSFLSRTGVEGNTPLHWAVVTKQIHIARWLTQAMLQQRIHLSTGNDQGQTAATPPISRATLLAIPAAIDPNNENNKNDIQLPIVTPKNPPLRPLRPLPPSPPPLLQKQPVLSPVSPKPSSPSILTPPTAPTSVPTEAIEITDPGEITFSKSIPIGRGGYALVYKLTWRGQEVAVKTASSIVFDPNEKAKIFMSLKQEIELLKDLHSPYIVQLRGYYCQAPSCHLVMEYVTLGSLTRVLTKKNEQFTGWEYTLSWPVELGQIACDISYGLTYLHDHHIIHRDLKSENVLITSNFHAKLADFGISKEKLSYTQTSREIRPGSNGYIAPELLEDDIKTPTSPRTDMYSYGIILAEMALRLVPSFRATDYQIIHKNARPIPPNDCPPKVKELMERCWDADPQKRPSAQEAAQLLSVRDIFKEKAEPAVKKLDANHNNNNNNNSSNNSPSSPGKGFLHFPSPSSPVQRIPAVVTPEEDKDVNNNNRPSLPIKGTTVSQTKPSSSLVKDINLRFWRPSEKNVPGEHNEYTILIMGSSGIGRTRLETQFMKRFTEIEYDPTFEGFTTSVCWEMDNQKRFLSIRTTHGTENFSAMRDLYIKQADGFILMFSLIAQSTFNDLPDIREQILRVKDKDDIPLVLVGNKSDLEEHRTITYKQGSEMAKKMGCLYIEASTKTTKNVYKAFYELIKLIDKERLMASQTSKKKAHPDQLVSQESKKSLIKSLPEELKVVFLGRKKKCEELAAQFAPGCSVSGYSDISESCSYNRWLTVDNQSILFTILVTSEQAEHKKAQAQAVQFGQAFVLVYDTSSKHFIDVLERIKGKRIQQIPCVLVGSRSDIEEGEALAKKYDMPFLESSVDVKKIFTELTGHAKKLIEYENKIKLATKDSTPFFKNPFKNKESKTIAHYQYLQQKYLQQRSLDKYASPSPLAGCGSNEFKLAICGASFSGKTALTIQFIQNHFIYEADYTFEVSYRKQYVIDEKSCLLDLLDTSGLEKYSALRDQHIRTSEAFIVVYSVCSRSRFDECKSFIEQILRVKGKTDIHQVPCILVGNGADLKNKRQVTTKEGLALAESYGMPFLETSAKTGQNVEEVFIQLVRRCWEIRYLNDQAKENLEEKTFAPHF